MEINLAERQISVDDLDILNQLEENSLRLLTEPAERDQVAQDFAQRREALTEVRQFSFTLAPADFVNQMQAFELAKTTGLWNGTGQLNPYLFSQMLLLCRITAWSGFESGGEPLPCLQANKLIVFGQALTIIQALEKKLAVLEEAEEKNSVTSASG